MRMRKFLQKHKANLYLLCFVFVAVAVVGGMFFFGNQSLSGDGVTQDGCTFDFSVSTPLKKTNRYYLRGDWEFYYGQLLSENGAENGDIVSVPGSWTGNPLKSTSYPSGGYASYRCFVRGFQHDGALSITVPNLACAYRVYVDGELVSESGNLSKTDSEIHTSTEVHAQKAYLDAGEHEIVIEVAANSFSGLYLTPMIADYDYENAYTNVFLALRCALIGIILYAAVVLSIFSALSKIRYYSPWLTVLFFFLALRMLISAEGYAVFQPWVGNLSYESMFCFTFASTFIIKLIAIIYFRDEMKLHVSLQSMALLCSSFLAIVVGVEFLPSTIYITYYFLVLQMFSAVADLYLINKLCQSLADGEKNAGFFCSAYMFLFVGITVDILYTCGAMPFRCSSFMPIAFSLFSLFITMIHVRNAMVTYHEARQATELKRKLEETNMSVMISQIQPHFLYNALNTIKSLIRRDPKTAEKAVIDFSYYLRGNMDSLTHTEPIPFRTELQHIQYYCNIELLRFSDKLKIEYDIQEDNFTVPTLSVQPLVENAIKHGVTKRPEGGTVKISTCKRGNQYIITVADDGVGFDASTAFENDGRSHVGLSNTRYRFNNMMHAEVSVESTPSVGTTVTVCLPIA